jgi:2-oxoglutarate ferredoxin oxidoreductase subunit beta
LNKGQYSPTSEQGKVAKSTPFGSPDMPLNPMLFALSACATFIARTFNVNTKGMQKIIKAAANHKGTSLVEIYQNCNIINDSTFSAVNDRSVREDRILRLNHGEILTFGKEQKKGIRLRGLKPVIVNLDEGVNEKELMIHDQYCDYSILAKMLSGFDYSEFPVLMGILRQVEHIPYEDKIEQQIKTQIEKKGVGDLVVLLRGNQVWKNWKYFC